jgi:regulator of protease activity HflC (stomatin/prohibitin superfamily)
MPARAISSTFVARWGSHRSIVLIVLGVVVFLLLAGIRVAQEYERGVVFRLGRYLGLRGPGIYWIIPLGIERSVIIDTGRLPRKDIDAGKPAVGEDHLAVGIQPQFQAID